MQPLGKKPTNSRKRAFPSELIQKESFKQELIDKIKHELINKFNTRENNLNLIIKEIISEKSSTPIDLFYIIKNIAIKVGLNTTAKQKALRDSEREGLHPDVKSYEAVYQHLNDGQVKDYKSKVNECKKFLEKEEEFIATARGINRKELGQGHRATRFFLKKQN